MAINYPLLLRFKRIAIAEQIYVEDATGKLLLYVKQKAFRLREHVTVYGDVEQTRPLYEMKADRIIDFNSAFRVTRMSGEDLGVLRRRGMKSLWRASYELARGSSILFQVSEENPWSKLVDGFLGEIPILGLASGYFFHPRYQIAMPGGDIVLRIEKKPALLEGRFHVTRSEVELGPENEELLLLATLMVILEERTRG